MAGYVPPEFKDFDHRHAITADVLRQLADQYPAVARDATDTNTPVGFAIAAAASAAGGGGLVENPARPGTFIVTNPTAIQENPDRPGTFLIGGAP